MIFIYIYRVDGSIIEEFTTLLHQSIERKVVVD